MSKKQKGQIVVTKIEGSPVVGADLSQQVELAEQESPDMIAALLKQHEEAIFVAGIREQGARFAGDVEIADDIKKTIEEQKKYAEFYRARLAKFPGQKPLAIDRRKLERQVVVEDYVSFVRARRDARMQYEAAVYTNNQQHKEAAQAQVDRMTRYINFFKPRFEKISREG